MALASDELKRRIEALRILRGLSQRQLGDLLQADGLGKHDVGRLERGEIDLRRVHLDALVRHLRVPDGWFTNEDLDLLLLWSPNRVEGTPTLEDVAEMLDSVADDLRHAAKEQFEQELSDAAQPPEQQAGGSEEDEPDHGEAAQ